MSTAVFTIVFACGVSMFMAWTIGAGSSGSTPFAPAVGANAISIMGAGFFVGILGFAGAALQGGNVAEAVGGELIKGVALDPTSVSVSLLVAGGLMALGIWKGYPISSAFTVTGAVMGSGFALGGSPSWSKYFEISMMWTVGPIFGIVLSYSLIKIFGDDRFEENITVSILTFLVVSVLLNVEFYIVGFGMIPLTELITERYLEFAEYGRLILTLILSLVISYIVYRRSEDNSDRVMKEFLLIIGSIVAFSAGGSQVGLAAGPIIPLQSSLPVSITGIVVGCGIGLLIGSWTGAPRMIKTVSQDYAQLGPRRSISALVPAFILAQIAIFFGVPISFNQMIVGCIFGAGLGSEKTGNDEEGGIGKRKMGLTIGAWIATLVGSFILSYSIVYLI